MFSLKAIFNEQLGLLCFRPSKTMLFYYAFHLKTEKTIDLLFVLLTHLPRLDVSLGRG